MSSPLQFDEIGIWSEIKLAIVKEYAAAYSQILAAQNSPILHHSYVDAFAGAGMHISKTTREFVLGSPLNALAVHPPFREYYLIDLEGAKVNHLREQIGPRNDVHLLHGDCNEVLSKNVFPHIQYKDFRRGLCILDPYGLQLKWDVLETAGKMGSLDIFLNFPVMDMNRNVLWHDSEKVSEEDITRMNSFWGDESWRSAAYREEPTLFGDLSLSKNTNAVVVEAFQARLKKVAGFSYVPSPIPMRNSKSAVVYYLFFASHKVVAGDIVQDIFQKYRSVGLQR
jgi:three-Cys-motif partner protein